MKIEIYKLNGERVVVGSVVSVYYLGDKLVVVQRFGRETFDFKEIKTFRLV